MLLWMPHHHDSWALLVLWPQAVCKWQQKWSSTKKPSIKPPHSAILNNNGLYSCSHVWNCAFGISEHLEISFNHLSCCCLLNASQHFGSLFRLFVEAEEYSCSHQQRRGCCVHISLPNFMHSGNYDAAALWGAFTVVWKSSLRLS